MSSKNKEEVSFFHDYNIYIPTRTITITGVVDIDMYENVIKNLHFLDSTVGEINIKLHSEGGDVIAAKSIFDAIFNCKNFVRIIVYGEASSSASLLVQAADERIMSINAHMMIHVGEEGFPTNHPRNLESAAKFTKKMEDWMEAVYLKRIKEKRKKFTRNQLKSMLTFDTYLSPQQCLELGLIDKIGEVQ